MLGTSCVALLEAGTNVSVVVGGLVADGVLFPVSWGGSVPTIMRGGRKLLLGIICVSLEAGTTVLSIVVGGVVVDDVGVGALVTISTCKIGSRVSL